MSMQNLEALEPQRFTLSEGIFKTPREITKNVDVRMRFLLPPGASQPFFLSWLHYWGWNSGVKPVGACPRVRGHECPADDMFSRLINRPEFSDKNDPKRRALMNLASDAKAYAIVVVLDEETGEPVDGVPLVYSMGANASNGPNQSAFHRFKNKFVSWGKLYKGEYPWGLDGHDVKVTFAPFKEYSSIADIEVYPKPGVTLDIEDSALPSLEEFAHSQCLSTADVQGCISEVLGEFAIPIWKIDKESSEGGAETIPETEDPDEEELAGEEV